jgi:Cof subfamily protein (haloacid dehalogenase superfamily)
VSARNIRLLLADVDGTLVTNDKVLTVAAKSACDELRRAGVAFAITSSRPPRGLRMLIEPLALRTPIAGCNGALIVHPDLSVIESHSLDQETAKRAVNILSRQGLDVWAYTAQEWMIRDRGGAHVEREARVLQFDPKVVGDFADADLEQVLRVTGVSDDPERVASCERVVRETLGERANAARSQPYYLDVTHPDANKGTVLETLSRRLQIPAQQIATIGDMPNDVSMFLKSGFSIAMGNASDDVKAQGSAVTDSNENDGFAKAVHKFILGTNVS